MRGVKKPGVELLLVGVKMGLKWGVNLGTFLGTFKILADIDQTLNAQMPTPR